MSEDKATIRIGGSVPRTTFEALTKGHIGPSYSGEPGVWTIDRLHGVDHLVLVEEGIDVEFPFEDQLEAQGIPYDRYNEIDVEELENPYEMVAFRPGLGWEAGDFECTGMSPVSARCIRGIIEDPSLEPADMVEQLANLSNVRLDRLLVEHPLPTLEIVDDEALPALETYDDEPFPTLAAAEFAAGAVASRD